MNRAERRRAGATLLAIMGADRWFCELTQEDYRLLQQAGLGGIDDHGQKIPGYQVSLVAWRLLGERYRFHVCGRFDCPNEPRPWPAPTDDQPWPAFGQPVTITVVPLDPQEQPDALILPADLRPPPPPDRPTPHPDTGEPT